MPFSEHANPAHERYGCNRNPPQRSKRFFLLDILITMSFAPLPLLAPLVAAVVTASVNFYAPLGPPRGASRACGAGGHEQTDE